MIGNRSATGRISMNHNMVRITSKLKGIRASVSSLMTLVWDV
jgi:hypothetical protein